MITYLATAALLSLPAWLQLPLEQPNLHDAPYLEQREFSSPITGERFVADVLKQAVPAASYDYDRCPHPALNTLAYTLVIDPATGYVADPASFEQPVEWDSDDMSSILGEPRFERNYPEGLPWANAYPWEKFENAAKLAEAAKRSSMDVANFWLLAAWSVRLDVISGHNEFDTEVASIFSRLPRRGPDPKQLNTLYELQLAAYWEELRTGGQLPDLSDADFSLALAWLYRSRGELLAAQSWLNRATLGEGELAADGTLYQYLMTSIELERYYLGITRDWLLRAYNAAELPAAQEAGSEYMLGEIYRRMGDFAAAKHWYGQASANNLGALSSDMISHQLALVESGRGY